MGYSSLLQGCQGGPTKLSWDCVPTSTNQLNRLTREYAWMKHYNITLGNCLDVMRTMESNSIDSIVTDPPYGINFMGKKWDYDVPSVSIWEEALRVLKPGGHMLAFAGTKTQHRMAVNIEDAGFEVRDMMAWVYGSGFPKSHNISKAIDKAAGAEREAVGVAGKSGSKRNSMAGDFTGGEYMQTLSSTNEAKEWDGWGTALKPALEPITVARKPLDESTVAGNILKYGTGGLNIDGCRVGRQSGEKASGWSQSGSKAGDNTSMSGPNYARDPKPDNQDGRFPANLMHDGSEDVVALFPLTAKSSGRPRNNGAFKSQSKGADAPHVTHGHEDEGGSAARFFYCAKASKKERGEGNDHPTVKPLDLMRYLCRLITPPGGIVLDPFMGSGSTGKAAVLEGFRFIGIDFDEDYCEIARQRIEHVLGDL